MTIKELRVAVNCLIDLAHKVKTEEMPCAGKTLCPYTNEPRCYRDAAFAFIHGEDPFTEKRESGLNPCPFCGNNEILLMDRDYGDTISFWLECNECGCRTPSKTVTKIEYGAWPQYNNPATSDVREKVNSLTLKWNRRRNNAD